ncbi:MAG: restriction endonuclease fold toxin 5 domain-containing protein [Pseudomonadota bacterium]
MAAAAPLLIETVALRVLTALGVGVVGGAASEAVKRRNEEADKARTAPIVRADVQTKAKEKCKACPPDKGVLALRNTAGWSDDSITYQMRIGQMPPAPAGYVTEWKFGKTDFDGFDPGQCLLKEAKARYDKFFDAFGYRRDFWGGHEPILNQAVSQSGVAVPCPPVQLRWYFMEPLSYRFFFQMFAAAELPIETVFQP